MKSAQLLSIVLLCKLSTTGVAAVETSSGLRGIQDASNSTEVRSRQLQAGDVYIEETTMEEEFAIAVIGSVPYVGSIAAFFVGQVWQNGRVSVWDSLKDRFESVVENKISEYHSRGVQASMRALKEKIEDYYNEPVLGGTKHTDLETVLSDCINIKNKELFMVSDDYWDEHRDLAFRMIELDVTFSMIHLAMLRERYLFGPHMYPRYNQSAQVNDKNWKMSCEMK